MQNCMFVPDYFLIIQLEFFSFELFRTNNLRHMVNFVNVERIAGAHFSHNPFTYWPTSLMRQEERVCTDCPILYIDIDYRSQVTNLIGSFC